MGRKVKLKVSVMIVNEGDSGLVNVAGETNRQGEDRDFKNAVRHLFSVDSKELSWLEELDDNTSQFS